jgi:hypothetical protein
MLSLSRPAGSTVGLESERKSTVPQSETVQIDIIDIKSIKNKGAKSWLYSSNAKGVIC